MYANVFRTYSVLDAHLLSMETQKQKKQQLEDSHSSRSLVAKKEEEKEEERKDSYCDVLQK